MLTSTLKFSMWNLPPERQPHPSADFFDAKNAEGERSRRAAAEAAVLTMLGWFKHGGIIAILDATKAQRHAGPLDQGALR